MDESRFHLNSDEAKLAYLNKFADAYKNVGTANTSTAGALTQASAPATNNVVQTMPDSTALTAQQKVELANNTAATTPATVAVQLAGQTYNVSATDVNKVKDQMPPKTFYNKIYSVYLGFKEAIFYFILYLNNGREEDSCCNQNNDRTLEI